MSFIALFLCFFSASLLADNPVAKAGTQAVAQNTFDVSKGFSGVVDKLLPAVVSIQATQVVEQRQGDGAPGMPGLPPSGRMGPGNPLEELFREFMGQMERPRKMQAVGAGFIVHCDGKIAYVVSNHHVVSEAKTLMVVLEDKTEIPGTLLASDERNDVAVIKLDLSSLDEGKRNLPTVDWANSDQVKTGDWVIAIGNPFNFGGTVTVGVVSHKGRYVPSGAQQDFEFIQHSAQINVGSSGGALFDVNGKVIGINNAIITNTGGNIGIGFAIPANVARQTVDQLVKYGKTRRGHLGVRIQSLNEDMAESQGLKGTSVIVGSIVEGGPSEGKLEAGDIILEFEGKKITESYILSRMVGETEIGKMVTLKIWRKGKISEIKIKVEEMPDAKKENAKEKIGSANIPGTINVAGLEVGKIPDELKDRLKETNKEIQGVIIVKIDPNSFAGDNGLLAKGDIIEQANHQPVEVPEDLEKIVKKARSEKRKNILLLVHRDCKPFYLPLRIDNDETVKPADSSKQESKPQDKPEIKKAEPQTVPAPVLPTPVTPEVAQAKPEPIKKGHVPEDLKAKPELQMADEHELDEQTHEHEHQHEHHEDTDPEEGSAEANISEDTDAEQKSTKTAVPENTLAKDSQNTVESNNESVASRFVNKLKSIFGKG